MNAILLIAAITSFEWSARIPEGGMKYEAAGDKVTLTLAATGFWKGGDGCLTASVPLYKRGTLDFDYRATCGYQNCTLGAFVGIYGIRTFFHDGCRDWRAYFPEPTANRITGYDIEPVQHRRIGVAELDQWHHCRISFDRDRDHVEYFIDDMSDPAYITGGRSVWGADEFEGGAIRIGGMGGSMGGVCEFKNLRLEESKDEGAAGERTETLIFNGMASSHFQVEKLLASEKPRVYMLDTTCSMPTADNSLKFSSLPGAATMARAKRIVMVDVPFQPNDVIPTFMANDIAAAVRDGVELIIIEGYFSCARGLYQNTDFAKILPDGVLSEDKFKIVDRTEILERKVGKGCVKVLRGFKYPTTVEESRQAFIPWAQKLF